jgi:predicted nucleic acid-binding protein
MNLFFDTSALVKYFHTESGTPEVIELIERPDNATWVSDLARVEFMSALYRKLRRGDIDGNQLDATLAGFESEWKQFNTQPVSELVLVEAEKLMRLTGADWGLRTLDAIHFASFALLAEEDWVFVVSDALLAEAVASEGFEVIKVALPG